MRPTFSRSRPALLPAAVLCSLLSACASAGGDATTGSGLETVFDSSRTDSLIARVAGEVPAGLVRATTEELRIQPDADDTSSFGEVYEFDVSKDGRIFAFDASSQRIFLFGPDGTLRRTIGRQGAGPGEFNSDNGMAVLPDGRLAVLDAQNARVSFFSADGEFETSWTVPSGFSSNNGLRTDSSGTLFVLRPVTAPREGEILGRLGLVRLAVGGALGDSLVAPDLPVQRVTYIAVTKGGQSSTSPRHSARFLWDWHPRGYFVAANGGKYEVESSREGKPLRIVRDAPMVPVPDDERAWDQERITFSMRMNDPSWTWSGPPIPATKPPMAALQIARDGRIWVRVSTPSQPIPEAERDPQRDGRSPPARFRDANEWEVFAADGRFLGRVRLSANAQWMQADGDLLWVLDRDQDGLPGIVRLKVVPGF